MFQRTLSKIVAAVMTALMLLSSCSPVLAASLTGRRDVMSNQVPGGSSNHQIRFITPTGVDANTDTITISFSTGFNLSSIVAADVALSHGAVTGFETSETVASVAAAGVWGASVSGQILTLTAPTDAALGEIAASDIVIVRIGTNAGGTHQIVNPSGGGGQQMYVSIAGTFGDVGGLDIPFADNPGNSAISISATVPSSGGGGGGGGGSSTDLDPPVIFNIAVTGITTSTATITWETNEPATTVLDWGTTASYTLGNYTNGAWVIGHSRTVTGLPAGTVIHYRITAADPSLNTSHTGDLTFSTTAPGGPIISNIHVSGITDTGAVINWDTNIPANSSVQYGTTTGYGSSGSNSAFVTSHSIIVNGLNANTLYHFIVHSAEPGGLAATSTDQTFTTLSDTTPPTNVFGFTATPGNALNNLSWVNPADPDFSFVRIRARTDGFPLNPTDGRLVYQGSGTSFVDSGLVNGTTYFYANFAFDSAGNNSSGAYASAMPFGPPLPPPPATTTLPTPPITPPTGGGSTTTHPVTHPPTPPVGGGSTSTTSTPPVVATTTPPVLPPPVTTTTTPPIPAEVEISPEYFGGAGSIELPQDSQGTIVSIPGVPVLVRVPTANLPSNPVTGSIKVGSSQYALTPLPGGTAWGASFVPSRKIENVPATVTFTFNDGAQATKENTISLQSGGRVLERGLLGDLTAVGGASVELYEQMNGQWQLWSSGRFGQANKLTTSENGGYSFLVPNGTYRLVASKDGYVTSEKVVNVSRNVASVDIILPREVVIPYVGPVLEALQSEPVRQTANVVAPVVAVVAVANLATGASIFSLLNYLWYLLTQPALLIGRKKRQKWGIVYNALSKQPVDLAAVRLIQAEKRLVIQTRITDGMGRFVFTVKPGNYLIEATKSGYKFPSEFLKGEKEDGDYLDVYHGEPISVKEPSEIAVNVPLDPDLKEETPRNIIIKRWLRRFQYAFSLLSVFITAGALLISPSWLMAGLLALQIGTFLLFRRLAKPKKPKGWGIVYDEKTRRPLSSVVVRVFDKKFNKLLETQVTNSKGEYGFFAKKNVYFVTAQKPGYDGFKSDDIDLQGKEQSIIDQKIPLKTSKRV